MTKDYYKVTLFFTDGLRRLKVDVNTRSNGTKFLATACVLVIPVLKVFLGEGYKIGV